MAKIAPGLERHCLRAEALKPELEAAFWEREAKKYSPELQIKKKNYQMAWVCISPFVLLTLIVFLYGQVFPEKLEETQAKPASV